MRVKKIKSVGKMPVYDISVNGNNQYLLQNGIVSHNSGGEYNSDDTWIITRSQEKENESIVGYSFHITPAKSRKVKEKSRFSVKIYWKEGIRKYSGVSDLAVEFGIIEKIKLEGIKGKPAGFKFKDMEIDARLEDSDEEFWKYVIENSDLKIKISEKYKI